MIEQLLQFRYTSIFERISARLCQLSLPGTLNECKRLIKRSGFHTRDKSTVAEENFWIVSNSEVFREPFQRIFSWSRTKCVAPAMVWASHLALGLLRERTWKRSWEPSSSGRRILKSSSSAGRSSPLTNPEDFRCMEI